MDSINPSYGNGVYNAYDHYEAFWYAGRSTHIWPNSALKIRNCIAVNEIADIKSRFVSSDPYMVVPPDMLRPRYLVVTGFGIQAKTYQPAASFHTSLESYQIPKLDPRIDVDVIRTHLTKDLRGLLKSPHKNQDGKLGTKLPFKIIKGLFNAVLGRFIH